MTGSRARNVFAGLLIFGLQLSLSFFSRNAQSDIHLPQADGKTLSLSAPANPSSKSIIFVAWEATGSVRLQIHSWQIYDIQGDTCDQLESDDGGDDGVGYQILGRFGVVHPKLPQEPKFQLSGVQGDADDQLEAGDVGDGGVVHGN